MVRLKPDLHAHNRSGFQSDRQYQEAQAGERRLCLPNWLGVLDANEFLIEAAVEICQAVWIEAHLVQQRRMQVPDVEPIGHGCGT